MDTLKGAWKVLELALAELEDLLSASVMQVRGVLDAMGKMREGVYERAVSYEEMITC